MREEGKVKSIARHKWTRRKQIPSTHDEGRRVKQKHGSYSRLAREAWRSCTVVSLFSLMPAYPAEAFRGTTSCRCHMHAGFEGITKAKMSQAPDRVGRVSPPRMRGTVPRNDFSLHPLRHLVLFIRPCSVQAGKISTMSLTILNQPCSSRFASALQASLRSARRPTLGRCLVSSAPNGQIDRAKAVEAATENIELGAVSLA